MRSTSKDLSKCFDTSLSNCIQNATNISIGSGLIYGNEDVRDMKFDDVAIYSAALSTKQIDEIYQQDTLKDPQPEPEPEPEPEPTVNKKKQKLSVKSSINKTYGDKAFSLNAKLTVGDGALRYVSTSPTIAAVNRKTGKVTIRNTGIAKITITASETSKYKKLTKTVTIKIAPKKASLSSAKSKAAKKVVLKWNTVSKASGYRIQYATNSKFKSARTATIKNSKTKTTTIGKLKRKKTYYFRIQTYKKSGNTMIYGAYSKAKKVKIK